MEIWVYLISSANLNYKKKQIIVGKSIWHRHTRNTEVFQTIMQRELDGRKGKHSHDFVYVLDKST